MKAESNSLKIHLTMRLFLLHFLLTIANALFAQDSATIKEINELVGPKFHFDTSNNNYGDNFYVEEKSDKNIIVNVWDTGLNNLLPVSKIYIFKRTNGKLNIIDSSAAFERDGRGPHVWISNDTIVMEHSCHGCTDENTYKFDKTRQQYLLVRLKYTEVLKRTKAHLNDVYFGSEKDFYNVNKHELRTEIWDDGEKLKSKKIIKKPLPKNFIPDLAHYIDPNGDNGNEEIYDKIF